MLPCEHTQSSRSPFHPSFFFLRKAQSCGVSDSNSNCSLEELHELELAQEKQTAQLEALPLSKASSNMDPHPAPLLTWRLT